MGGGGGDNYTKLETKDSNLGKAPLISTVFPVTCSAGVSSISIKDDISLLKITIVCLASRLKYVPEILHI
jgi:hypothetical protein